MARKTRRKDRSRRLPTGSGDHPRNKSKSDQLAQPDQLPVLACNQDDTQEASTSSADASPRDDESSTMEVGAKDHTESSTENGCIDESQSSCSPASVNTDSGETSGSYVSADDTAVEISETISSCDLLSEPDTPRATSYCNMDSSLQSSCDSTVDRENDEAANSVTASSKIDSSSARIEQELQQAGSYDKEALAVMDTLEKAIEDGDNGSPEIETTQQDNPVSDIPESNENTEQNSPALEGSEGHDPAAATAEEADRVDPALENSQETSPESATPETNGNVETTTEQSDENTQLHQAVDSNTDQLEQSAGSAELNPALETDTDAIGAGEETKDDSQKDEPEIGIEMGEELADTAIPEEEKADIKMSEEEKADTTIPENENADSKIPEEEVADNEASDKDVKLEEISCNADTPATSGVEAAESTTSGCKTNDTNDETRINAGELEKPADISNAEVKSGTPGLKDEDGNKADTGVDVTPSSHHDISGKLETSTKEEEKTSSDSPTNNHAVTKEPEHVVKKSSKTGKHTKAAGGSVDPGCCTII